MKTFTFTFTNKETYLAYRSEWKANYKIISQEIRTLKADIKETQKAKGQAGSLMYRLYRTRIQAHAMMEECKASKIEAQQQYLAAHNKLMVA